MKKVIALVLAVVMTVLMASCAAVTVTVNVDETPALQSLFGRSSTAQTEATEAPVTQAPATQAPATQTAATETPVTETPVTATPATETPATETPATEAPATETPAASGIPSTKDEIIAYYVAAYNKIGTDGGKITRTYDYTSNYNNILNINGNSKLESLANTLMNKFMVETTDATEYTFADMPPVGIENLQISSSQINQATFTDNGDTYTVVLTSTGTDDNYEIDSVAGQGSAGVVGPLLRTEDVSGAAGSLLSFEGLHAWYAEAKVTATVDKASGHITAFDFETPCVLHFDQVKVTLIKVENCDIGLLFQQKYTIAY